MPSFFENIRLTLFGSNLSRAYQPDMSPFENFQEMCKLPFFYSDSQSTTRLIEIIRSCHIHSQKDYDMANSYRKRKSLYASDIVRLQAVKTGIEVWLVEREHNSSRVQQIRHFHEEIERMQSRLLHQYHNDFMAQTRQKDHIISWMHPLHDGKFFKRLPPELIVPIQQAIFKRQHSDAVQIARLLPHRG